MTAESAGDEPRLVVTAYDEADRGRWDEFVAGASNGTLLHTRHYLGYHGSRFDDESLLLLTARGELVAVLPAARDPQRAQTVVTHPGITFGGLVYDRRLRGTGLLEALQLAAATYADRRFDRFDYRPVPPFFRRRYGDEDSYALFRLGARRYRCHLSAIVDLARRPAVSGKKRNMQQKAVRAGVQLESGMQHLDRFWPVLSAQLDERYAAAPVHTVEEIHDLVARFSDDIGLTVATIDGEIVAGALTYRFDAGVVHTQYLASTDAGRSAAALDLLCTALIDTATEAGARYFSFGASTEDGGAVLNDPLYRFKHAFGADGAVLDGYELDLPVRPAS
jgi:hypothetical protein